MFAGACAGITEHVAMYPVDTIKTRMQALAHPGQQVTLPPRDKLPRRFHPRHGAHSCAVRAAKGLVNGAGSGGSFEERGMARTVWRRRCSGSGRRVRTYLAANCSRGMCCVPAPYSSAALLDHSHAAAWVPATGTAAVQAGPRCVLCGV